MTDLFRDSEAMALGELEGVIKKQICRFQRVIESLSREDLAHPLAAACAEGLRMDVEKRKEVLKAVRERLGRLTARETVPRGGQRA